ncbi:MAG: hypothetical protein K2N20_07250, partial [Helicobacter sp.]|nr:hypothetical protein [Helicobacter sp.]
MMIFLETIHSNEQSMQRELIQPSIMQDCLRNHHSKYDFLGQSYASLYPNLHKYPATMLPQIGLELLKDFGA